MSSAPKSILRRPQQLSQLSQLSQALPAMPASLVGHATATTVAIPKPHATVATVATVTPVATVSITNTFRDNVHAWLKYENDAKQMYTKLAETRAARNASEEAIVTALRAQGMDKAILQIKQGAIHMSSHTTSAQLSYSLLEDLLPRYFAESDSRDQTADLLAFIRQNRGSKTEFVLEFKQKKE